MNEDFAWRSKFTNTLCYKSVINYFFVSADLQLLGICHFSDCDHCDVMLISVIKIYFFIEAWMSELCSAITKLLLNLCFKYFFLMHFVTICYIRHTWIVGIGGWGRVRGRHSFNSKFKSKIRVGYHVVTMECILIKEPPIMSMYDNNWKVT